ncbi:MAG: TonB-dependent receptor [Pseudomonadota bacterium]
MLSAKSDMISRSVALLITTSALSLGSAYSQSSDSDEVRRYEPITVTAQKREQSITDVPATIQAFDASDLQATGIASLDDLQYLTPGLSITPFQSESQLFIRGVGNNINAPGLDPSNAVHLNGIYLSRPSLALVDFYDVERIEVLKGPQGTLYGRNATGGAVNIITARPDDEFAYLASAGIGTFNARRFEGMLNIPFEAGAIRFAALHSADDGYTDDIFDGDDLDKTDVTALRARALFDVNDRLSIEGGIEFMQDNGNVGLPLRNVPEFGGPYIDFPGNATGPRDYSLDGNSDGAQEGLLGDVQFTWTGDQVVFKSITGYLDYEIDQNVDTDGTSNPLEQLTQSTSTTTFSQEFQLQSNTSGPLEWIVGAFYLDEETDHDSVFELAFALGDDRIDLFDDTTNTSTEAWAVFAEGTYAFDSGLSVTVGGRYTEEEKEGRIFDNIFLAEGTSSQSFDAFTPRLVLAYDPTGNANFYASVSRGFKSGGTSGLGGFLDEFDEETVTAYEAGVKSVLADGAVRLNAAVFLNDYKDAQIFALEESGVGGFVTVPVNIPESETSGFELDGEWAVSDVLSLRAGYTFLDTEIQSDITLPSGLSGQGLPLPNASENQFNIGAELFTDLAGRGNLTWTVDYAYQDDWLAPVFQNPATETLDGYGLLNAGVTWESDGGGLFASLVGRNLTDETYATYRADFTDFAAVLEYNGRPQMVMFTVGIRG